MKVSYNWLQTYFKDPLPTPEQLGELLTFHAFEIDALDVKDHDTVLDVKVLPDRAAYALSHLGIAREISAITKMVLADNPLSISMKDISPSQKLILNIHDKRCIRDTKIVVENIVVEPSPVWLKEKLEVIGQRSINNIVDATNFVMFDRGQPLHAFDFDKLIKKNGRACIGLKKAVQGSKITTLGGKEYELDADTLVFVDEYNNDALLDIAGIKGGVLAEVDSATKNIVVLAANFDPSYIRKTSTKYNIRTDASKRSENNISPELTVDGMLHVLHVIKNFNAPDFKLEGFVDYYPVPLAQHSLSITTSYINTLLGIEISEAEIVAILSRLSIGYKHEDGVFQVFPPVWRRDLNIPQDIVEEIGRIYGYTKLPSTELPETSFKPGVVRNFHYENEIRDVLVDLGFSEVYTYVFQPHGDIEIEKPLASDKKYLRKTMSHGIAQALELNARNADLLGLDTIKLFEIGAVFADDTHDKEYTSLCIAVKNIKKSKIKEADLIREALSKISSHINIEIKIDIKDNVNIVEVNLTDILQHADRPGQYHTYPLPVHTEKITYKPFSHYPFAVRDIAVFTPEGTIEETVKNIISDNSGEILLKDHIRLFDVFTKEIDGVRKTSYAFRMIFQSFERTLTDEEINAVMKKITDTMNGQEGWHVR